MSRDEALPLTTETFAYTEVKERLC